MEASREFLDLRRTIAYNKTRIREQLGPGALAMPWPTWTGGEMPPKVRSGDTASERLTPAPGRQDHQRAMHCHNSTSQLDKVPKKVRGPEVTLANWIGV